MLLPVQFDIGPLNMTGLRAYLLVMIPLTLRNIIRDKNPLRGMIDLMFLLHIFWMWVSILQVAPESGAERAGSVSADFIGGYFIARAFIRNAQEFQAFIKTLALLIIVTLPLAMIESLTSYVTLNELFSHLPGIRPLPVIDIPGRLGLDRAQAVFAHPIHYGLFCSTATALYFVGMSQDRTRTHRIAILSLTGSACFLSLSSGAFLSLLIQIFIIGWAWVFTQVARKWLILAVMCCLIYAVIDIVSDRSPYRVFLSYATFSAHNAYWRSLIFDWGLQNIWANPILGVGNNGWTRPAFMKSESMDNFWLYIAVKYGIPAFILLITGFLGGIFAVIYQAGTRSVETEILRKSWIICLVGISFTLATVHVWTSVFSYVFFLFGAGLWLLDSGRQVAKTSRSPVLPSSRGLQPTFSRGQLNAAI